MRNLYFAIFGIVIFIVSTLPPMSGGIGVARKKIVISLDRIASIQLFTRPLRSEEISSIEQKNRQLYTQLVACRTDYATASKSGSIRPKLTMHRHVTSVLSYSGGQWIVLSGTNDHLRVGDVVVVDAVFLGTLSRVSASYSEIETVSTISLPMLVQHEKSKAVAVLRSEKDQIIVQFSKKIEDIQKDDLFLTIPDGVHTHDSYPLARVDDIKSGNSDGMTLVGVEPIDAPVIGSTVDVLLSEE